MGLICWPQRSLGLSFNESFSPWEDQNPAMKEPDPCFSAPSSFVSVLVARPTKPHWVHQMHGNPLEHNNNYNSNNNQGCVCLSGSVSYYMKNYYPFFSNVSVELKQYSLGIAPCMIISLTWVYEDLWGNLVPNIIHSGSPYYKVLKLGIDYHYYKNNNNNNHCPSVLYLFIMDSLVGAP